MKLKPPQEPRSISFEKLAPKPDRERRHDPDGKALVGHAWAAIKPLTKADLEYDFSFVDAEHDNRVACRLHHRLSFDWQDARNAVVHGPLNMKQIERLWSIETGVIEGLYTLDRRIATLLLTNGFVHNIIKAPHTNIDPDLLLQILRDHEASVEPVHGYIRDGYPLSPHTICALHALITAHQDTHFAVDSLGRHVNRPLAKGDFKKYPNNPTRTDGRVHQYAPPEQVDSEIANLVRWYEAYAARARPLLTAA